MARRDALLLAAGLLCALGVLNVGIYQKEALLAGGRTVFLELAPVDPRSLMQGDYMALRFQIANDIQAAHTGAAASATQAIDGRLAARLDDRGVARFSRVLQRGQMPQPGEVLLRYRVRDGRVKFATNAWFFEEGQAKVFEPARYGEFRVAEDGNLLLTGMRDQALHALSAPAGRAE